MRVVKAADVPRVRAAVAHSLRPFIHEDLDTITLLVTELLSNALRHGGSPAICSVDWKSCRVRVEVCDANPTAPEVLESAPDSIGGRGMKLVDALSSSWGWHPNDDGKCVWFEIAA